MNKLEQNNEPIRLELLSRTTIKISHGRDAQGKPVYFKVADALRSESGSKKSYVDSEGESIPNGYILLSPNSRIYQIPRKEAHLAELLKNHEACHGSKFGSANSLFKVYDPLEDKKAELELYNKQQMAQQVFLKANANDINDLCVYLGHPDNNDLSKKKIYEMSINNPVLFLQNFGKPTVAKADDFYSAPLLGAIKTEALLKRALQANVVLVNEEGALVFEGTKLGANLRLSIENLLNNDKDGMSKFTVLIKDKMTNKNV